MALSGLKLNTIILIMVFNYSLCDFFCFLTKIINLKVEQYYKFDNVGACHYLYAYAIVLYLNILLLFHIFIRAIIVLAKR